MPRPLALLLAVIVILATLPPPARAAPAVLIPDQRFFAETGFRIEDDAVWQYFERRGGVASFGFPISRPFRLFGQRTQLFQRAALQVSPEGEVQPLNLLDPEILPLAHYNGLTLPLPDPEMLRAAPSPDAPDYAERALAFVQQQVPDEWEGLPVGFARRFLRSVPPDVAFPDGDGDPGLLPLISLELWGLPTSPPTADPNNRAYVYQRFQRGIMHFDATCRCTGGVLIGEAFKAVLTGQNLPPDLAEDAVGSPFLAQYRTDRPDGLSRPDQLPDTDLAGAFQAGQIQPIGSAIVQTQYVVEPLVNVREGPGTNYPVLAKLERGAAVLVTAQTRGSDNYIWLAVKLWDSLDGWMRSDLLSPQPAAAPASRDEPGAGAWTPPLPRGPAGPFPLQARGRVQQGARAASRVGGEAAMLLPAGALLPVIGWATADDGHVWYRVGGEGHGGWVEGDDIVLQFADPIARRVRGQRLDEPLSGKAMWATYPLLRRAEPRQIVAAARANGLRAIVLEVATSKDGFYGAEGLDGLLPAAHASGIAVVAWVYAALVDIPRDVDLARQAASYVTPDGHRADGLIADVEENMLPQDVKAYGELVRAALGDDYLWAIATFAPNSYWGERYPWTELTRRWNVVAPMAYWHSKPREYSPDEVSGYVRAVLAGIRARTGRPDVPIHLIGQTYDMVSATAVGDHNPGGEEVRAALAAAYEGQALGMGFFDWAHATPDEWHELRIFPWERRP